MKILMLCVYVQKIVKRERIGVIQGSKGKIISEEAPGLVGKVTLKLYDGTTESFDDGFSKDRVVPEFKAFIRAVNENDLEFCYKQLKKVYW